MFKQVTTMKKKQSAKLFDWQFTTLLLTDVRGRFRSCCTELGNFLADTCRLNVIFIFQVIFEEDLGCLT